MEKSLFFNSISGDRKYLAEDFATYFASLLSNGVFLHQTNAVKATATSGLTVKIAAGNAFINGYAYSNTTALNKTLDAVIANRIDRIALRLDMASRNITVTVKKGTAATTPTAPALIRTADIWELGIADIALTAGTTTITSGMITDLRANAAYCGGVTMMADRDDILGDITNTIAYFTQAATRANISTGESTAAMLGKIKKYFADLKALAFLATVATSQIDNSAVTADKIAANAVTTAKLNAGAVTTAEIADANVTTAKIADGAVTAAKIADGTIKNAEIAADAAIAASKISGLGAAATKGVDTTPTTGSTNLITSGGIKSTFNGFEKRIQLYSGTSTITSGSITLTSAPSTDDVIELHYMVDGGRGDIRYVRRICITSSFSLADLCGGSSLPSGFTATCYTFSWSGTTLTLTNKYYLLNFANDGGSLLDNVGGIQIFKIYKITTG